MIREPALDRRVRGFIAVVLLALAFYGIWSIPAEVMPWGTSPTGVFVFLLWTAMAAWALATAVRQPATMEVAGFVAVAVLARVASAILADGRMSPGDSHWYLVLARNLLDGRGLIMVEPYMGVACRALFPPVYPIVLAGWGAFAGFSTISLLLLSTLIDCIAAVLIVRLATEIGARRAGIAAAMLYLIWPSVVISAPLAQKEGLGIVLILSLALAWLRASRGTNRWRQAAAIGLSAALLALLQPGQAPLATLFGLALLPMIGWRRVVAIGVPAAAIAVVAMTPWWVRNAIVFGGFVPLTSAGGISLWIGNNANATGSWMPQPASLHGLDELRYGRAAGGLARDWIVQHPADFVRLSATKFVRATGLGISGALRLAAMRPPASTGVIAALLPVSQGAQIVLLLCGGFALRLRRDPAMALAAALLAACLLQLALFAVWFEFGERHREFITPFILLPIAIAVARIAEARREVPRIAPA